MPFEATISAFAAALGEPSASPPAMTRGRLGAPDARRFSVYRNNVAVGLIGALEARYPASRRIAGDDVFRAIARAFVAARKPRSPVMIAYGEDFPEFVAGCAGVAPCLADVARLENAWVEAYHAADAAAATIGDLAELSPDLCPERGSRFTPPRGFCAFRPRPPRSGPRPNPATVPPRRRKGSAKTRSSPAPTPRSGCARCRRLAMISP